MYLPLCQALGLGIGVASSLGDLMSSFQPGLWEAQSWWSQMAVLCVCVSVSVCLCLSFPLWVPGGKERSIDIDLTYQLLPGYFLSESGPSPCGNCGPQEGSLSPTALQWCCPAALGWQLWWPGLVGSVCLSQEWGWPLTWPLTPRPLTLKGNDSHLILAYFSCKTVI